MITVRADGDNFDVFFLAQTEVRAYTLVVAARTGTIVWKEGDTRTDPADVPASTAGYVLPGIVAGEIIAVYRQAVLDHFISLTAGAYNLWYVPLGGALDLGFRSLNGPPQSIRRSAPPPIPARDSRCFSGWDTGPAYTIAVSANGVTSLRGSRCK